MSVNPHSEHLSKNISTSTSSQPDNTIHRSVSPLLPEIPAPDLDLDISSILGSSNADAGTKVQKRASNVVKLSQENEKLTAELKAMSDRLEAAERRREELARKEQKGL